MVHRCCVLYQTVQVLSQRQTWTLPLDSGSRLLALRPRVALTPSRTGPVRWGRCRQEDGQKGRAHGDHEDTTIRRRLEGRWVRSGRLFFFVPLFFDVEITQCEEEDRSRQDTETKRQTDVLSSTRSEREKKTQRVKVKLTTMKWTVSGWRDGFTTLILIEFTHCVKQK